MNSTVLVLPSPIHFDEDKYLANIQTSADYLKERTYLHQHLREVNLLLPEERQILSRKLILLQKQFSKFAKEIQKSALTEESDEFFDWKW